jgi:MoxR-like ATPase
MTLTLHDVAHAYLADEEFQAMRRHRAETRDASIPDLQAVVQRFIRKEIDMQTFPAQLEKTLRSGKDDWDAIGIGFMMEINTFRKYHSNTSSMPEIQLRDILTGLNTNNLGLRIETFYSFLLEERNRLRVAGKSSTTAVAPGNSAYIISMFAYWLVPLEQPIIYYHNMRKGLYQLIKSNILTPPLNLQLGATAVEIRSNAGHQACLALIRDIETKEPRLKTSYWAEYFGSWVSSHLQSLTDPSATLFKEADNTDVLAKTPTEKLTVQETPEAYILTGPIEQSSESAQETTTIIAPEPLQPTSEPLLTRLIREVQNHILINEETIRRIYHALLAGHVILTGPPGTGKTELARLIPEILWKSELKRTEPDSSVGQTEEPELTTQTAYTTRLVTATDEWSVRTLISGIAPQSKDGVVSYKVQYGHLTNAILKNWSFQGNRPEDWSTLTLHRTTLTTQSGIERGLFLPFRGQWLVIDEFNRAPIDLALGDALTALGGNDILRVAIEGGSAELPIPQDFRIIGTLNSFDRSYLNQISEALKRRFSFIEILPPSRAQREAEQGITLFKALSHISHLSTTIEIADTTIVWGDIAIEPTDNGTYEIIWSDEPTPFRTAFEAAWHLFEVIRIYRQLGTAQAITLMQRMLITGILQEYTTSEDWITKALDPALCDTLADQLQVLLPDEIDTLLLYLTTERIDFRQSYHALLARLSENQHRLYGQLLSLSSISDENGQPLLSNEQVEQIAGQEQPTIPEIPLKALFHLDKPLYRLPQFTRRLRLFKAERGL